jgi:hypothetical protein
MWIILGIIAGIVVITVIVVPTTVILTKKNNTTTTTTITISTVVKTTKVPITEEIWTTNRGVCTVLLYRVNSSFVLLQDFEPY